MKNIDIVKFSTVFIKVFLVFYAILVYDQTKVLICLIMIALLTLIYAVCAPKRAIYEVVCSFIQIALLYGIYYINHYTLEGDSASLLLIIKVFVVIFTLILTTYLLFRELDIITSDRESKRIKLINKQRKQVEREV